MDYHRYSGYGLLGVLVFRVYWGVVGGSTARFANFVRGPRAILEYLRNGNKTTGHNPLGALSVLALLTLLIVQVSLGLFAVDVDGLESGPLSYLISFDTGRACAEVHAIVFNVLMVAIALHLLAILCYWVFKRDNLLSAMITGNKVLSQAAQLATAESLPRIVIGVALAVAVVWVIV
jgi:cytochrome b